MFLFLYGPFWHGAWHVYIVYNVLSLNISLIYIISYLVLGESTANAKEDILHIDVLDDTSARVYLNVSESVITREDFRGEWWLFYCLIVLFCWSYGIMDCMFEQKSTAHALEGVNRVACFIFIDEQLQQNRGYYFPYANFAYLMLSLSSDF